jgi:membrane protein
MARAASYGDERWQSGRGREAESPSDIPARGWRDVLSRVKDRVSRDKLSIISAGVAFYALLAVFPAIAALISIYGLLFDPEQVSRQVGALEGVLPPQAMEILLTQMREVAQTSGGALGVGAVGGLLVALWSASAGVRTLMEALNIAYDEEEKRGTLRFYGTALLLTLGAIIGAIVVLATLVLLPVVVRFLGLGSFLEVLVTYARWPVLAVAMILGLAIMYRFGPSRDEPKWRWVSWGAVTAIVLWIIGSALFSLYVSNFGSYNETYGSVGAVVILLLWFLVSAYVVLIGAEINAELERRAYAADTVAKQP